MTAPSAAGTRREPRPESVDGLQSWWPRLVAENLARYPLSRPIDVYKLLHQATMGPGHFVADRDAARSWLDEEATRVARDASTEAPTVEMLRPDGALARVHVRSYVAEGRALEALLAAFVETAAAWPERPDEMAEALYAVGIEARRGRLPISSAETDRLFTEMAARGYPSARHSDAYRFAYLPAYRVADPRRLRSAST